MVLQDLVDLMSLGPTTAANGVGVDDNEDPCPGIIWEVEEHNMRVYMFYW